MQEVGKLEGSISIPVEIQLDDKGYIDRSCPSEDCGTQFKILYEDWINLVGEQKVFCPLCRQEAICTEWNTDEQSDYHRKLATSHAQQIIRKALRRDARRFNSRKGDSFIKLSMSYRQNPSLVAIPATATDVMTQDFQCTECSCKYSSIGTVFFCPACGHSHVIETFSNTLETVQKTVAAIPVLRQTLTGLYDENFAEDSVRHILENGLCKVVASFQKYSESSFMSLPNSGQFNLPRNVFQRLDDSNLLWKEATSTGYTDILDCEDYHNLGMYFQQRHLLEHQEGIVDQQYIDRANDNRFAIGQRLVVSASSVSELVSIMEKLSRVI